MRILFVSANPDWTPRLDILDELRELTQSLKGKAYELELLPAAQPEDLREAIDRSEEPFDIVHFSGHATEKHGLLFAKADGKKQALKADRLNELFAKKPVKLAVLNACHTKSTANGITGFANTVIGTKKKVADDAAKLLTEVLYSELSNGTSVDVAYGEATRNIEESGFENVYLKVRKEGREVPDLEFAAGNVEIDQANKEEWDRYFFQRYLDDQIDALTQNVRINQYVLYGLFVFGVSLMGVSWYDSIRLRQELGDAQGLMQIAGSDALDGAVGLWDNLWGRAVESANETPLLDWLTQMGEAIPVFIAAMQSRWCVHGNEKIRQLTALRELVENSEKLSPTLRTRLHKILDQSVMAADAGLTIDAEELTAEEQLVE